MERNANLQLRLIRKVINLEKYFIVNTNDKIQHSMRTNVMYFLIIAIPCARESIRYFIGAIKWHKILHLKSKSRKRENIHRIAPNRLKKISSVDIRVGNKYSPTPTLLEWEENCINA